jgi:hypothetical protein
MKPAGMEWHCWHSQSSWPRMLVNSPVVVTGRISSYSEPTAEARGISQPSFCCHYPRHPDARHRVCRNGRPHPLGASLLCAWDQDSKPLAYWRAHDSVHEHDDSLAPPTDPAVGSFLSPAMFPIVGILLLFLGHQLLHRGVRRYCPSASLATAWTGRGDHGCFDVWNFRKCAVRHCGAADRERGPSAGGKPVSGIRPLWGPARSHPPGTFQSVRKIAN